MKVVINGREENLIVPISVAEFIEQTGWKPTQIVVEHNGNILPRNNLSEKLLSDGDCLEIIEPVAGG
jgi:thiamine biosynthesis protein ThiS